MIILKMILLSITSNMKKQNTFYQKKRKTAKQPEKNKESRLHILSMMFALF